MVPSHVSWPPKKELVSHADALQQSNDRTVLELHNSQAGELAVVGTDMGTDLLNAKFNLTAFECCAVDKQFGNHTPSDGIGSFAGFFLVMNMILTVGDPASPSR